jgi:hypothetical protein
MLDQQISTEPVGPEAAGLRIDKSRFACHEK